MRVTPYKIIVVAALSVLAPAAYGASRAKPAPKSAAHATAKPSRKVAEAPRKGSKAVAKEEKHGRHVKPEIAERVDRHGKHLVAAKLEKPVKGRKGRHQDEEDAPPVRTKLVHGRRVVLAPAPAPRLIAQVRRPAYAPVAPAPEVEAEPALPEIHVTHDRKQHFSAEPANAGDAEQDSDAPRKATTADFMSVDTPAASPAPIVRPATRPVTKTLVAAVKSAPPAPEKTAAIIRVSPTAGVVVGSKVELKPTPLPLLQVAPEPLVSLYDKRGRLIVPPAMKGSHEVLVHQNVMADSDGLERIQDDEDLSRMRVSKMLVAIPDHEGLQTDERLPDNRRYCRPWTAAFLSAMARAHYARFHSPLQVNSAVRTVEFQQRLIRTNGNAAPAEGETASPHLTGQAVDIAKHGLSMTEIAWLRGYLLPLVQEGKVDVEEEFQQACFHISVYKKYMPQVSPKRLIAEKRHAGGTLAVAIP